MGLVAVLILAFMTGAAIGVVTRASVEDLTAAPQPPGARDSEVSREVNRTLLELWKMENVQAARGQGRIR